MRKSTTIEALEKRIETEHDSINRSTTLINACKAKIGAYKELLEKVKKGELDNENPK